MIIKKAFHIAASGKPGVVVVDLPKDIQKSYGSDVYPRDSCPESQLPSPFLPSKQIEKAADLLNHAKKPVFLVGGGIHISQAQDEMLALVEKTKVPVITTIMGKGAVPSTHKLYVGNIGIHGSYAANTAISQCDVLFSIGTRFNDRITGKTEQFASQAAVIHVDIEPASVSKNIPADIPIIADAKETIRALIDQTETLDISSWTRQLRQWKEQYPLSMKKEGLTPEKIMEQINTLYDHAIIAADVGQNQLWATQFLDLNANRRLLISGGLGTMGYGPPAGIGAKMGNPQTDVLVISGDGGMQMNIQEIAAAVVYELPITICVLNNGYLGNVRQWQEMFFNRRYANTCMRFRKSCSVRCAGPNECCPEYTPDFIRLAESYGAKGIRVTDASQIAPALLTAKNTPKVPTVIEFIIDREANVLPIVPPGNAIEDMILGGGN